MTREEAIDLLDNLIGMIEDNHKSDYDTAFRMAIKALQQEPCNTDTCKVVKAYMNEWDKPNNSDAISRQAVLDCFKKWQPYMATRLWDFEQELSALPPVNPQEPKTGHWIMDSDKEHGHCDQCGYKTDLMNGDYHNFCRKCGARMIGDDNG